MSSLLKANTTEAYANLILSSSLLGVVTVLPLWALAPSEPPVDKNGKIDWVGSALGTLALMLFSFVWK